MNLESFQQERDRSWRELESAVAHARGRPERLGPEGVHRLGRVYRAAAADLALARRRFPGDPVTLRLERLVASARTTVYGSPARQGSLRSFLSRGYWRRVAERPGPLALAWALLLVPAVAAAAWALGDPGGAVGLVPGEFEAAADPPVEGRDFSAGEGAAFSGAVLTNNVQVTFFAFAAGITLGLGTALITAFNGLILGAVFGLAADAGNLRALARLLSVHGPLELSCIVVGATAGLRVGGALLVGGARRRGRALVDEARAAVEMALGTAPWLVVCALAEGFLTGPDLALPVQLALGGALFALFWGLVAWRGRAPRPAPAPSP